MWDKAEQKTFTDGRIPFVSSRLVSTCDTTRHDTLSPLLPCLNAQQDPHIPWSFTGVTAPAATQSTSAGSAAPPEVDDPRRSEEARACTVVATCAAKRGSKLSPSAMVGGLVGCRR